MRPVEHLALGQHRKLLVGRHDLRRMFERRDAEAEVGREEVGDARKLRRRDRVAKPRGEFVVERAGAEGGQRIAFPGPQEPLVGDALLARRGGHGLTERDEKVAEAGPSQHLGGCTLDGVECPDWDWRAEKRKRHQEYAKSSHGSPRTECRLTAGCDAQPAVRYCSAIIKGVPR